MNTSNEFNVFIQEYENKYYIATHSPTVLVLQNKEIISSFTTLCEWIYSLSIDSFGLIGILCGDSNTIHFHSSQGEYLGLNWISPVKNSIGFKFSMSKQILLTNSSGIYIFEY